MRTNLTAFKQDSESVFYLFFFFIWIPISRHDYKHNMDAIASTVDYVGTFLTTTASNVLRTVLVTTLGWQEIWSKRPRANVLLIDRSRINIVLYTSQLIIKPPSPNWMILARQALGWQLAQNIQDECWRNDLDKLHICKTKHILVGFILNKK